MDDNPTPQDLRAKYQAAIERVWRQPDHCPICDSNYWNIGDLVDVQLRGVPQDRLAAELVGQRRVYVYVPITCIYCGYTMFFHSGVLDVRETERDKAKPPLRPPGEPT